MENSCRFVFTTTLIDSFDAPKNAKRSFPVNMCRSKTDSSRIFSGTHLQPFALWNRGLELAFLLTCLLRTTVQVRNSL